MRIKILAFTAAITAVYMLPSPASAQAQTTTVDPAATLPADDDDGFDLGWLGLLGLAGLAGLGGRKRNVAHDTTTRR